MRRPRLILTAGLLVACGGALSPELFQDFTPGNYSTGAEVVAEMGEPCHREGRPGGQEVWSYCAEECTEGRRGQWCRASCEGPCPGQWHFHLVGGLVVEVSNPEGTPPPKPRPR